MGFRLRRTCLRCGGSFNQDLEDGEDPWVTCPRCRVGLPPARAGARVLVLVAVASCLLGVVLVLVLR